MVLFMIGLGLGDEKDVTVKGLEAIKGCKHVFLEHYTAIIGVPVERLEAFYDKKITLADRECVESGCKEILVDAKEHDVAFLVVGDVFAATTHSDLMLRAVEQGIEIRVIHNASIMNAVSACGLQLYNFGQSVSICFFTETWKPDSFYEKIIANQKAGLHTLCLLDIKVKEQSFDNMAKGIREYEPPRYMTINTCIEQLLEVEKTHGKGAYNEDSLVVGLARVGQKTQRIVSGSMKELLTIDFGGPLHSLVIPSEMHFLEQAMLDHYHWDRANRQAARADETKKVEAEKAKEREEDRKKRDVEREERKKALEEKKKAEAQKKIAAAEAKNEQEEDEEDDAEVEGIVDLFDGI